MSKFIEHIIEFSAKNKFIVFLLVGMATGGGLYAMRQVPLDAIPDLSDTQVIIYSRWDRSPDIIEDQVTYPIVSSMLGAPRVKAVRGFSDFGFSYVYIIFEDGTDIYWARSRTLEYLSKITARLPEGVQVELGPDATGVGWVFQYALIDETGQQSLADLRSFQDWYLRYYLQAVPGVAEVATVGGFVRQYQITVNPNTLLAYNIPLMRVIENIRKSNNDIGGRLIELGGAEYMVRGRGYIKSIKDIEDIVVGSPMNGTPVTIKQIANVTLGPDIRRGIAELDGKGEVVGGIVVMRHKENALNVINKVKAKLKEIEPGLPKGVKIVTTYDRSDLIKASINTVKENLIQELLIVSFMLIFFLLHFRSALVPIIGLPIAIIISFIPMSWMGLTSNIMSLGGIVVAIGDMVDASIVFVENVHKRLDEWAKGLRQGTRDDIVIGAMKEVGPPIFASLVVMAVAFMPVFTLEAQEGRLFKPLAFTKNYSIFFAALLAITLTPALVMVFVRGKEYHFKNKWLSGIVNFFIGGKIISEDRHPVSRALIRFYRPIAHWAVEHRNGVVIAALISLLATVPAFMMMGSEFMPPLNEGSILYMPTTLPGLSVTEAGKLLQVQDKILKSFPEVERVFGKAGRATSSTDPAPFSMMETTVVLKDKKDWRKGLTWEKLIEEMNTKMKIPGTTNAWTMPIKARIDMLTTGVRTPVGIKIFGSNLEEIEKIGTDIERILTSVPGTRSVYAERVAGGYFVDFDLKRDQLARYGLTVADAEDIIMSAIGGENISTTVEGRERYSINLRYGREFRDDVEQLKRVLVPTMDGQQIPMAQIADIHLRLGPSMIRDENGLLSGYVYVDMAGRDVGRYVAEAKKVVKDNIKLPTGYALTWSGQYEYMQRVKARLMIFVPLTIFIIFILYYFTFQSITETLIVMLSVPFALIGGIWFLFLLGYNMSIAVWVGLIALAGVAAETGSIMIVYLDEAYARRKLQGKMNSLADLYDAVMEGAVQRLRPKLMTVGANIFGLMPVMMSTGTGADVMKRIAAPLIGGLTSSTILTLVVLPAIYTIWKYHAEIKHLPSSGMSPAPQSSQADERKGG
ncbi:MAG TPA: CusA/CzcA family heavy metal efflux RND transporter [Candidatus Omnitrophica bacterium]|uniref:Chemiosmotic efflux system B protein A n=1 Tax=Candidatus Kaiserbacteria bacterium GW2011_GWA2_49_19 TaxID=1618669 RepID=A0A0G1Y0D1_9BACT|nr:MAG: Chemiosmotic efflux system B protein A [Candidatus Kaiserbacteria bacterium GW2011_GWA2_49_19]HBR15901.1 CusA/CzcA family heavy metal efflux RND transporter [Candidatus Omnitrophota bacterium]